MDHCLESMRALGWGWKDRKDSNVLGKVEVEWWELGDGVEKTFNLNHISF